MFELGTIDGLVPEESGEMFSTLNKSSIQQYQLSLANASNFTSHILHNEVHENHKQLLNKGSHILDTVSNLLKKRSIESLENWKTSISELDVEEIFKKELPPCQKCCTHSSTFLKSKLNIFLNTVCKCPGLSNISSTNNRDKPNFVNSLTNVDILSEANSTEENRSGVFKPRFGKFRSRNGSQPARQSPSIPQEPIDIEKLEEEDKAHSSLVAKITFKTAKEQLLGSNPAAKRTLGTSRKAQGKFVSPMIGAQEKDEAPPISLTSDERLKHVDPKMVELIESEIIDKGAPILWDDIAGLQMAKSVIQEAVVWPLLRPDIFTGLRRPPKGILLFGPPGTGKTLIGKCVAAQCNATFFSISASSLTSKWIGDGEKMVRALFAVARCHQPAVIFIDEIDSLLTQRSDSEHEATRRIKTEFLVQFDGAATEDEDRLLIVGATNRPQELDEAARRRLVKRLYIPLPEQEAREQIISNLLKCECHSLTKDEVRHVSELTAGYSGADMRSLCSEAAMGPIRSVPLEQIVTIQRDKVRPVCLEDFINALQRVRPSVSQDDLGHYVKWNKTYGQGF